MGRSVEEIYKEMDALVESHSVHRFESLDDEDTFEPFIGTPLKVGNEMAVRVEKDNGVLKKDEVIWIDPNEFCFMKIEKVKA